MRITAMVNSGRARGSLVLPAARTRRGRAFRAKRERRVLASSVQPLPPRFLACRCGVCRICVLKEELEDAKFTRHVDPDYYRRDMHRWESPLSGGATGLLAA